MNRSEVFILIALLFGVYQQITDGNPICHSDNNGTEICGYNTTSCEPLLPDTLTTCFARAQSLKISTVNTVDFRTEIIRHIIPPYMKSYTIVQQNLINVVLATHLVDRTSMEKLTKQLKTAFTNLTPNLADTMTAANRILELVNNAIQQSVASITAGEKIIQAEQKCISEVNTHLTSIQHMIANATNKVNQESQLPAEAQPAMNFVQWIYSRLSGNEDADGRKLNATESASARVECYHYFAKHLQKENKTLSEHVAQERAALTTLQNSMIQLRQKQTIIANITSELTRILLYASGLNSSSTSHETFVKALKELEKLITPLNNIYNEILKHYVTEPFAESQITGATVDKFKANMTQFTQNILSINIYVFNNNGNQKHEDSHNKNVINDSNIVTDNDKSNNSNSVDTGEEFHNNDQQSSDDTELNNDNQHSSDDDETSNDDQRLGDDSEVNNENKPSNDDREANDNDQQSNEDDEVNNDSQQPSGDDGTSNDDKQPSDDDEVNNNDKQSSEDSEENDNDQQSSDADEVNNDNQHPSGDDGTSNDDKQPSDDDDEVNNNDKQSSDDSEANDNDQQFSDADEVNNDNQQPSDDDGTSNDDKQPSDDDEVNNDSQQPSDDDGTSNNGKQSSDNSEANNDDQESRDHNELSSDDDQSDSDEDLNSDETGITAVAGHNHFKACQSGHYNVATTWCKQKIPTASDIVVIPTSFIVIIPALSQSEFFRLDIYGTLQVHIDSTFPPAHSFNINIFNRGLLTDTGGTDEKNQTTWYFPSNSILFIYSGGRLETRLPVAICHLNSTVCTKRFLRTDKAWTILLTDLGQMGAFQGIYLVAIQTGNITTSATWCGGQTPTVDMCNTTDKCNLLILSDVTLTISSTADQPLFDNIKSVDNRGILVVAVSFRLTPSQMTGSVQIVGGTVTLV